LFTEKDVALILKAVKFAADKHRHQRRRNEEGSPYINHPIDVAETLWRIGGVRDIRVLVAAVLHDTIEDTDATSQEIEAEFGAEVLALVEEVSDDKSLPKQVRKQLQIENAPHKSYGAKLIKLGDKINNIRDLSQSPPPTWSLARKQQYLNWTEQVIAGLRGTNAELENHYDRLLAGARQMLNGLVDASPLPSRD
jgi:guanosine-3',5'-bis(diphosphate) 3'-pyrophosphohydrolase